MSNRENKNNLNKIILNKINLKSIIDVINKKNSFIKRQLWALNPEKIGIKYNLTNTTSSKKLKEYNILEKKIGNSLIRETNNKQWTTKLGEQLVADTLKKMGKIVSKPKKIQKYLPDLETPEYIYEVKTRSWTTPGTAGEKVLGTPIKYSEIPKLYGKPLIIICVGLNNGGP